MAELSRVGQASVEHASGAEREQFWRGKLKAFSTSGLSIRGFCRRESLAESAFYFWRREIAARDAKAAVAAKQTPAACQPERPAFVPVMVASQISHSLPQEGLVIELRGGRVLRLPSSMSASDVAQLIHALEAEGQR